MGLLCDFCEKAPRRAVLATRPLSHACMLSASPRASCPPSRVHWPDARLPTVGLKTVAVATETEAAALIIGLPTDAVATEAEAAAIITLRASSPRAACARGLSGHWRALQYSYVVVLTPVSAIKGHLRWTRKSLSRLRFELK